jgi:hypothetical protein
MPEYDCPSAGAALVRYLTHCGGSERCECWDAAGAPDPSAARALAEELRARLGDLLDQAASVEQVGNRVTLRIVRREPAVV